MVSVDASSQETNHQANLGSPETFDGENVGIDSSIVLKVSASKDASAQDSVVGVMVAGGDLNATGSVGSTLVAGGDISFKEGSCGLMIAGGDVLMDHSKVGILVGGTDTGLNLGQDSRILITLPGAIAIGVSAGITFALIKYLLHRS